MLPTRVRGLLKLNKALLQRRPWSSSLSLSADSVKPDRLTVFSRDRDGPPSEASRIRHQRIASLSPQEARLISLLSEEGGWSASKQSRLTQSGVVVDRELVLKVFGFKLEWDVTAGFFWWAAEQPGFLHCPETYRRAMVVLARRKKFRAVDDLLRRMWDEGRFGDDVRESMLSALISLHARSGAFRKASAVFLKMEKDGLVRSPDACNRLLSAALKLGWHTTVAKLHFRMLKKGHPLDLRSHHTLIASMCAAGELDAAFAAAQNLEPESDTYCVLIQALCEARQFNQVCRTISASLKCGFTLDPPTFTLVVKSFCTSGRVETAHALFHSMLKHGCPPNPSSYNALIKGSVRVGDVERALDFLHEMRTSSGNCPPNYLTYMILLDGLCNLRELDLACQVLSEIENDDSTVLSANHYNPVILRLTREGRVDDAHLLLNRAILKGYIFKKAVCAEVIEHLFLACKTSEAESLSKKAEIMHRVSRNIPMLPSEIECLTTA